MYSSETKIVTFFTKPVCKVLFHIFYLKAIVLQQFALAEMTAE